MQTKENPILDEKGVLENVFVFAVIASSILAMGTLSAFAVQAQRYQAGLDLATHTAVRDLVGNVNSQNPALLARDDLITTFQNMGLSSGNTSINVSDSQGRCGTIAISESKVLNFFWSKAFSVRLSSNQSEPNDPLASGAGGTATCIGQ
ncbi:MAG: hypothetical protein M0Z96_06870 [Actinomycetota bacterium]|nr:hypothetical protein [Actinomycetota bacterium]